MPTIRFVSGKKSRFSVGQKVTVRKDEGFDIPEEVMGKTGVIVEAEDDYNIVVGVGNITFLACYYHLEPIEGG